MTGLPTAGREPHPLDLGAAWYELAGLPFTFAFWKARAYTDPDRLRLAAVILGRQRGRKRTLRDRIVHDSAVPRGWPADLAREYLGVRLRYDWTERAVAGLEAYWAAAEEMGLIGHRRPLAVLSLDDGRPAEPRP